MVKMATRQFAYNRMNAYKTSQHLNHKSHSKEDFKSEVSDYQDKGTPIVSKQKKDVSGFHNSHHVN